MNISIIGCKCFKDYQVLKWKLDELTISQITTCGDRDINDLVARYAKEKNIKLINIGVHPLNEIALSKEYYKLVETCDILLVFWFGESKSVISMIKKAKQFKKELIITRGYHPEKKRIFY